MSVKKSIVLSTVFPSSKNSMDDLKKAVKFIKPFSFQVVEFYCANCNADDIYKILGKHEGVFLAAALQKERNLNISSYERSERRKALDALAECFSFAQQAGAKSVLINSGARPEDEKLDGVCLEYLKDSILELHNRVKGINILLEPGDRDVEYHHLIGHTDMAVSFIDSVQPVIPEIGLVFDTSHIFQLGEDLMHSWSIAEKYCNHIHLANCVLDRSSPMYGDKHPSFGYDGGVFNHEAARRFYNFLLNENRSLTVGIEVICREKNEQWFFNRLVSETEWFFK